MRSFLILLFAFLASISSTYAVDVPTAGLVNNWELETNARDTHGALHGSGNVSFSDGFADFRNLAALNDKGIDLGNYGAYNTVSFTYSFIINVSSFQNYTPVLIKKTNTLYSWAVQLFASGSALGFTVNDGPHSTTVQATLSPNVDYHVAVVRDGTTDTISLFIDGAKVAETPDTTTYNIYAPPPSTVPSNLWIGGIQGSSYSKDFRIKRLLYYAKSLNVLEIEKLYQVKNIIGVSTGFNSSSCVSKPYYDGLSFSPVSGYLSGATITTYDTVSTLNGASNGNASISFHSLNSHFNLPSFTRGYSGVDVPPFTNTNFEATTASTSTSGNSWVGGSASYGWRARIDNGSGSVSFDSTTAHSGSRSLKLSKTTVGGARIWASHYINTAFAYPTSAEAPYMVPVIPSTRYRIEWYWKGNGLATNQAVFEVGQFSSSFGAPIAVQNVQGNPSATWEKRYFYFTTTSTARYVIVDIKNTPDSFNGNIADLWVDDINLYSEDFSNISFDGSQSFSQIYALNLASTTPFSYFRLNPNAVGLDTSFCRSDVGYEYSFSNGTTTVDYGRASLGDFVRNTAGNAASVQIEFDSKDRLCLQGLEVGTVSGGSQTDLYNCSDINRTCKWNYSSTGALYCNSGTNGCTSNGLYCYPDDTISRIGDSTQYSASSGSVSTTGTGTRYQGYAPLDTTISLTQFFSTCPAALSQVDISFIPIDFEFAISVPSIPFITDGFDLKPFSPLSCPIRSIVNAYYFFTNV